MRYSPVLLAGLVVLSGACNQPVDPEKTTRAVEWLEHYYKKQKFPAVKGVLDLLLLRLRLMATNSKLSSGPRYQTMPTCFERWILRKGIDTGRKLRVRREEKLFGGSWIRITFLS